MTDKAAPQNQPFEENLAQLETILSALENNDAPLAENIAQFEAGMKLIKTCHAQLTAAETTVEKLITESNSAS